MAILTVHLVSPDKHLDFQNVLSVVLEAETGSMGFLPGHADILGHLNIGILKISMPDGDKIFAVSGGFFEVRGDTLSILADAVERPEDIDADRALNAKQRAEERLARKETVDFDRARIALLRALNRLRAAGKKF
jgi:F-type H+-transporting ATPase subunit epsilon